MPDESKKTEFKDHFFKIADEESRNLGKHCPPEVLEHFKKEFLQILEDHGTAILDQWKFYRPNEWNIIRSKTREALLVSIASHATKPK